MLMVCKIMRAFFDLTREYAAGEGFGMFTLEHFGWLIFCAALTALLCLAYKKEDRRRKLRRWTAFCCLGVELLRALLLVLAGRYDIGTLPLHLCGMAVYICLFHALRGGALTGQFLYAFCLPGAASALLFPDWSYYPALHFLTVSGFLLHGLIVAYVLMQVLCGELRPDIRRAPACLGLMLAAALPVYVFDILTHTNYMFLNWPSKGSPLEWFSFLGRPGYVLGYLPMIAAAWALMYLPFRKRQ